MKQLNDNIIIRLKDGQLSQGKIIKIKRTLFGKKYLVHYKEDVVGIDYKTVRKLNIAKWFRGRDVIKI